MLNLQMNPSMLVTPSVTQAAPNPFVTLNYYFLNILVLE